MIINLRGNSGSGKTYTTRRFMELCKVTASLNDQIILYRKSPWVVLGRYSNVCGGCDTIKTQAEIVERIQRYTQQGRHIWLEGLILSTIYGTVGDYSEQFGDDWVFAYLQPPIDVLLSRIRQRRAAAGNDKPLNETKTRNRVAVIERNKEIVRAHGRRVIELDWQNPLPELLKIARKA